MDSKIIVSIFFFFFAFLTHCHESNARTRDFESPSPSPSESPSPSPSPSSFRSPSPSPVPGPSKGGCWLQLMSCHNRSLTACIDPSSTISKELLLYVKNEGESPLQVNVTVSHAKRTFQYLEIRLPKHQFKKVNISKILGGNSSIQLDSGDFGCVIHIKSSPSGGRIWWTDISPLNGAYILFLTGLIVVGGTRACCKQGHRIPYQELEMGQPGLPSANNKETADGSRMRSRW